MLEKSLDCLWPKLYKPCKIRRRINSIEYVVMSAVKEYVNFNIKESRSKNVVV